MSALIWLAIVAVWGFVLIPMWLRHHDSVLEQRSADRFSTAMRVLARRASVRIDPDAEQDVETGPETQPISAAQEATGMPGSHSDERAESGSPPISDTDSRHSTGGLARQAGNRPAGTGDPADASDADRAAPRRPATIRIPSTSEVRPARPIGPARPARPARQARPVDRERAALVRLRRRRLFVLLAAMPVSIVLAATLGGMWIVVQIIVDVGLVSYVLHLRRAAKAYQRLKASRAALERRIAAERAAARSLGRSAARPGAGWAASQGSGTVRRRESHAAGHVSAVSRGDQHGRGAAAGDRSDERLTLDELATARADTVDLGGSAAAARRAARAGEPAEEDGDPARAGRPGAVRRDRADPADAADAIEAAEAADDHPAAAYGRGHAGRRGYVGLDEADSDEYAEQEYAEEYPDRGYAVRGHAARRYPAGREVRAAHPRRGHGDVAEADDYAEMTGYPAQYADRYQDAYADGSADHDAADYAAAGYASADYAPSYKAASYKAASYDPAAYDDEEGYAPAAGYADSRYEGEEAAYYADDADDAENADGAYDDSGYAEEEAEPDVAAGGMVARPGRPSVRPGSRPITSRPGRVQVNPPGTHGGLTASPAASASLDQTAAAAPSEPEVDEVEPLIQRRVVGG